MTNDDRWIVRTGVGWSRQTVVIEDCDGEEIAELAGEDEATDIANAMAIVGAHDEINRLNALLMERDCEIERWQESTGLENAHGDPEGIGPETNARNIQFLTVALQATLDADRAAQQYGDVERTVGVGAGDYGAVVAAYQHATLLRAAALAHG